VAVPGTTWLPPKPRRSGAITRQPYHGQHVSLDFKDADVHNVLRLLAEVSKLNIVATDDVRGKVTLRLFDVPWDQALDLVLQVLNLESEQEGNVIRISTVRRLREEREELQRAQEAAKAVEPLRVDYIKVNYAKASDLAGLIKSSAENSLLSARGSVTIDERTNTLLIQDTADRLQDVRRLVTTLDIPIRQVLIEARIVIVNDDFSRNLGVRFGANVVSDDYGGSDGAGFISPSGVGEEDDDILLQPGANAPAGNPPGVIIPGVADRYMVNLPVANPAGRIALTLLDSDYIVDLEISAAQAEGRGEVISSPRVVTANQREAVIEQGVEIPYQESSSSGATTIQFKKAVLALRVTPQITPDNRIIMDLTVNKDSVGQVIVTSGGANVPSIDTREIVTQVLVSRDDPAFAHPTKPVGPVYSREEADERRTRLGWQMVEEVGRGYRRVVASPHPQGIVEFEAIRAAVERGTVVIACGGGGIPVELEQSRLRGVEAVIDKDRASGLLATELGAELFLISTSVDEVYLHYGKHWQRPLGRLRVEEARRHLAEGEFAPGSMGPKIEAAISYLEHGGRLVIIASPEKIRPALEGTAGTRIVAHEQYTALPLRPAA